MLDISCHFLAAHSSKLSHVNSRSKVKSCGNTALICPANGPKKPFVYGSLANKQTKRVWKLSSCSEKSSTKAA